MKVLMVTSSYPLFEGDGTAPFIEEIAKALAARGHRVDLVLPAHPRLDRADGGGLRFFPFSYAPLAALNVWGYAQSLKADRGFKWKTLLAAPFAAFATAAAVRRRLSRDPYDVVHAHWIIPSGVLSQGPATTSGRAFVVSLHGSDVFAAERNGLFGVTAKRAFERAGAVTACSKDLRTRAIVLGAIEARTRTVPYGVDAAFFGPGTAVAADKTNAMRVRLGASASQTLVVAVGRLVEKKGFRHLIDAVGGAPNLHLAIVGDGDLQSELQSNAATAQAAATFAGRFSRTEIRDALECADIVAVPSVIDSEGNVDGLPNTLLEAMAAGKAIVASRVAGIPDVMTHDVEGILVPQKDSKALRAALLRLEREPPRRKELGAAALSRVQRDLTWDRVASTFEECYVQAQTLAKR
jgi:glycosyltransferase involved in cell wall biosynthesis